MKPTTTSPGGFASTLNVFLSYKVQEAGGDASGRWLEKQSNGQRKKDYWKNLIADERAMNTNDISILAAIFDTDPFTFVKQAMTYSLELTHDNVTPFPNVRGTAEDDRELPEVAFESKVDHAADTDDLYDE